MTILSSTSRVTYTGNGAVSNYSYTFKIFDDADLLVTVRHPTTGAETELTLTTDYTVTILANGTGSIDLVDDSQAWLTGGFLTDDWVIVIRRVVELIQDTDIRNQGAFYPEAHENAFDYLMMATQQLQDEVSRSFKVNETDDPLTLNLPTAAERANNVLGFDADGEPIAVSAVGTATVSTFMQTVLDDTTAAAARTTLGFTGALATTGSVDTDAIVDDAVTNAKLANMDALSVKGNATSGSANPTDIAAANDYEVIQRVGTAISFGPYKKKYRNATTTDAIALTDDVIVFSGASFTATLPTAVGCQGKVITLQHGGTTLSQKYTLNTTSAQTIGGIASGSFVMCTNGETLFLMSDNANWLVLDHVTETAWTAHNSPTFQGFGTPSAVNIIYKRRGSDLLMRGFFTAGTVTAAEGRIGFPTGIASISTLPTLSICGSWQRNVNGAETGKLLIEASVTYLTLGLAYVSGHALSKQNVSTIIGTGNNIGLHDIIVPVSDWQP